MKVIPKKCPTCGKKIEYRIENNKEILECTNCDYYWERLLEKNT